MKQVESFSEKPVIRDCWINAGFFVFEKRAAEYWQGHNLESEILPNIAAQRQLYTYLHQGFWKSMDTSKDQQELEKLIGEGSAPWTVAKKLG